MLEAGTIWVNIYLLAYKILKVDVLIFCTFTVVHRFLPPFGSYFPNQCLHFWISIIDCTNKFPLTLLSSVWNNNNISWFMNDISIIIFWNVTLSLDMISVLTLTQSLLLLIPVSASWIWKIVSLQREKDIQFSYSQILIWKINSRHLPFPKFPKIFVPT